MSWQSTKILSRGKMFLFSLAVLLNLTCGSEPTKHSGTGQTGNHNPRIIVSTPSSPVTATMGASVTFSVSCVDDDNDSLSYSWTATGGTIISNAETSIVWRAPSNPDTSLVTVTISDNRGGSVSYTWHIYVGGGVSTNTYNGRWISEGVVPLVSFTVRDSLGQRVIPYTSGFLVFYSGQIECEVFEGGVYNINTIPPENSTANSINVMLPYNVLTVRGGDDAPNRVYFQGMFYAGNPDRLFGQLTIYRNYTAIYDSSAYFNRE